MKKEIKAIIFDIGGVLELPKKIIISRKGNLVSGVHSTLAKKFKVSLDQWFDVIDSVYVNSITGEIPEKKMIKKISSKLEVSEKKFEKIVVKIYRKKFKTNKKLYRFAFKLKKRGYKIGILSDQWQLSKKALMPEKYIKKFDEVIVSCDVGLRKPDPKIFKLALKKLRLSASETIFIDNQKWNIDIAKKLGMRTILFKDNKQVFKQLFKQLK
jgi:putative hydrolase of the HAD superfamily